MPAPQLWDSDDPIPYCPGCRNKRCPGGSDLFEPWHADDYYGLVSCDCECHPANQAA